MFQFNELSICFIGLSIAVFAADPAGVASTQENSDVSINRLAWLAGVWEKEKGETLTEEHWMAPGGGMMLAMNRTSKGDRGAFEFLRVQQESGVITLYASPSGKPPVAFKMTSLTDNQVVFENPKHDFPQKISYRRERDRMHVRIEAVVDGETRKTEWTWDRKK